MESIDVFMLMEWLVSATMEGLVGVDGGADGRGMCICCVHACVYVCMCVHEFVCVCVCVCVCVARR